MRVKREATVTTKQQPLDVEFAPDHIEVYADNLNVSTGLFGQTLYFGTVRSGEKPVVRVTVRMSPQMAKVMGVIISRQLKEYEEKVGPIALPVEALKQMGIVD